MKKKPLKKEPLTLEELKEHYRKFGSVWLKLFHSFARARKPDKYISIAYASVRMLQHKQHTITTKQEMEVIEAVLFERQVLGIKHDILPLEIFK